MCEMHGLLGFFFHAEFCYIPFAAVNFSKRRCILLNGHSVKQIPDTKIVTLIYLIFFVKKDKKVDICTYYLFYILIQDTLVVNDMVSQI